MANNCGRPKLRETMRRSCTIIVRVDPIERMMADAAAKESGKKLSVWARERILAGLINVNMKRS